MEELGEGESGVMGCLTGRRLGVTRIAGDRGRGVRQEGLLL